MVKNLPAVWKTWVQSQDWEDPLEKRMATHSSLLAWRIPQSSLSGYSPWGGKETDTMSDFHFRFSMSSKCPAISIHYFQNEKVRKRESPWSHRRQKLCTLIR